MEDFSEENITPRKSTRTRVRARRVSTSDKAETKREEPLKRVKKIIKRDVDPPKPEIRKPELNEVRKAPTPFAFRKKMSIKKRKRTIVSITLLIIGVGASAGVGMTDSGQINVQETIEARNERIRNNKADERDVLGSTVEVPVQNTNGAPPKRLKGLGIGSEPQKPVTEPEVSSSTATSSDETASSTEEISEGSEEIIPEEVLQETE